jgi:hypothetical protein
MVLGPKVPNDLNTLREPFQFIAHKILIGVILSGPRFEEPAKAGTKHLDLYRASKLPSVSGLLPSRRFLCSGAGGLIDRSA